MLAQERLANHLRKERESVIKAIPLGSSHCVDVNAMRAYADLCESVADALDHLSKEQHLPTLRFTEVP